MEPKLAEQSQVTAPQETVQNPPAETVKEANPVQTPPMPPEAIPPKARPSIEMRISRKGLRASAQNLPVDQITIADVSDQRSANSASLVIFDDGKDRKTLKVGVGHHRHEPARLAEIEKAAKPS